MQTAFQDKQSFVESLSSWIQKHGGHEHSAHERFHNVRYWDAEARSNIPEIDAVYRVECIGGYSGGSCWGGEATAYTQTVDDPGLGSVIDAFLETYYPKLSFLEYRRLMKGVTTGTYSYSGYYGNSTEYQYWRLSFDDAWAVLSELEGVAA